MEWRRPEVEVRVHRSMKKNGDRAREASECLSWEVVIVPSFPGARAFSARTFDQYDGRWDSFRDKAHTEAEALVWATDLCSSLGVSSFTVVPYKLKIVHTTERDDDGARTVEVP